MKFKEELADSRDSRDALLLVPLFGFSLILDINLLVFTNMD